MMNKDTTSRTYGVLLATMYAILVTGLVYDLWPRLHISLVLLTFIGLWIGFFLTGIWISYRPDELNKKLPISGQQLRRTKKEFYDWLRSQGHS